MVSRGKNRAVLGAHSAGQGVMVVPQGAVTQAEMQQVLRAVKLLPSSDLKLLAKNNIQIHLYPTAGLEDSLLGATNIVRNNGGKWAPTLIRVAVRAGLTGTESIGEIVQHEVGHAVAVLRSGDTSENAAIAYAAQY